MNISAIKTQVPKPIRKLVPLAIGAMVLVGCTETQKTRIKAKFEYLLSFLNPRITFDVYGLNPIRLEEVAKRAETI